jgi:hypothetical protein
MTAAQGAAFLSSQPFEARFSMETTLPPPRAALVDPSLWGVLSGNVLLMVMALALHWPVGDIMWIYWWQSVAIGATNFVRMWTLKEFSTEGFTSNGRRVPETQAGARSTAIFFAVHYGFFHLVYAIFLATLAPVAAMSPLDVVSAGLCVAGFIGSHVFSLRHNATQDFKGRKPNLGAVMFYPYLRIIPMHLTIIFGGVVVGFSLPLFMLLKTLADCGMHVLEHRLFLAPTKVGESV